MLQHHVKQGVIFPITTPLQLIILERAFSHISVVPALTLFKKGYSTIWDFNQERTTGIPVRHSLQRYCASNNDAMLADLFQHKFSHILCKRLYPRLRSMKSFFPASDGIIKM